MIQWTVKSVTWIKWIFGQRASYQSPQKDRKKAADIHREKGERDGSEMARQTDSNPLIGNIAFDGLEKR